MTKISNATPGPRGLHTKTGVVWLEGYSTVDAEFENAQQLQAALDTGWFVKGERKAPGGEDGSDVASLRAEIDRLTRTNAALETENGQLKADLAAAKGNDSDTGKALSVKEQSSGWYAVVDADGKVLTKNLRKADLAEFEGMNDADKAAFIDLNKAD